jgi:uncharacterized protein
MKLALVFLLAAAPWISLLHAQKFTPEEQKKVDAALPAKAPAKPKKARRILITNLAKRGTATVSGHAAIAFGAYAIEQMGKRTGAFEVVVSNDVEMFRPAKLKEFDAVFFNNTQGVLWDDAELKQSLLDFINGGHGLIALHAGGAATFNQPPKYDFWPAFGEMIGGTDNGGHPWMPNESFFVKVDDPKSPINAPFKGQGFELTDEVFQLQEPTLRDHMHVLISVDIEKTGVPKHNALPVRQKDKDYPLSLIRRQGKGRVFYCGLGHNPTTFQSAPMLAHFLAGIQYALGDLKANDAPSAKPARK